MTTDINKAVATVMRERRKAKGLTQTELAKHLGMGQSGVSKLERAVTPWTVEHLAVATHVLDTTPSEVVTEALAP